MKFFLKKILKKESVKKETINTTEGTIIQNLNTTKEETIMARIGLERG